MIYTGVRRAAGCGKRARLRTPLGDLSGAVSSGDYSKLAAADRRAIVEILRDTKPGIPACTSWQRKNPERGAGDDRH